MIVLMFQDQFIPKILDGSKHTTIRKIRKRGNPKPGDILSLRQWTGKPYRSKQEVIKEVVCEAVDIIYIYENGVSTDSGIYGKFINRENEKLVARKDGFSSWADMLNWFRKTHGLPFEGNLIRFK